jgi:hypothetical protein
MDGWLGYLIGFGALVMIAPLAAWLGIRHGRKIRGAAGLALALLGLGQMFDPPRRYMIEATEGEEREAGSSGEPKDASGGS